jgi:hypothetical protein
MMFLNNWLSKANSPKINEPQYQDTQVNKTNTTIVEKATFSVLGMVRFVYIM